MRVVRPSRCSTWNGLRRQAGGARRPSIAMQDVRLETCPFCKGTGRCGSCDGENKREAPKRRLWSRRVRLCGACHGYGKCNLCQGTGKRAAQTGAAG